MGKVKITKVKSAIGQSLRQKRTLEALGLRKMNQSVVKENNSQIQGMITKVNHLVTVEDA